MRFGSLSCGYENLYMVSNEGRVKALPKSIRYVGRTGHDGEAQRKERLMPGAKDKCGYIHVRLVKDGKAALWKVHHLVACAFLRI